MSAADHDSPPPPDERVAPETAWRLILGAAGWVMLAIAAGLLCFFLLAENDYRGFAISLSLYGILGLSVFVRGRQIGNGDLRAGVGDGPVSRRPLIATLCVLTIVYVAALATASHNGIIALGNASLPQSPWLLAFQAFSMIAIAPLVEELTFRGWLWAGLRKRWGVLPTGLATGILFLLVHFPDTWVVLAARLPVVIVLTLARHWGQSVRASIPVHAANNLTLWAFWLVVNFKQWF